MGVTNIKKKNTMQQIEFKEALALSNVLGKCVIKNIDSKLFIPIIKVKSSLTKAVKEYSELETSIFNDFGFKDGIVPNGTSQEEFQKLAKAQRELADNLTDVESLNLFTAEDIEKLVKENPDLKLSELEVIYRNMVK